MGLAVRSPSNARSCRLRLYINVGMRPVRMVASKRAPSGSSRCCSASHVAIGVRATMYCRSIKVCGVLETPIIAVTHPVNVSRQTEQTLLQRTQRIRVVRTVIHYLAGKCTHLNMVESLPRRSRALVLHSELFNGALHMASN